MSSTLQLQLDPPIDFAWGHIGDQPPTVDAAGNVDGDWDERRSNKDGRVDFLKVDDGTSYVLLRADGYEDEPLGPISMPRPEPQTPIIVTLRPKAATLQVLHKDGWDIKQADGSRYVHVQATSYLHFQRWLEGQESENTLYPGFDGYNVTFLMKIVPEQAGLRELRPENYANFYQRVDEYLTWMETRKKRLEATLLCDCAVMGVDYAWQERHTESLYDVLRQHPWHLVQLVNEPENGVNGVDYGRFRKPDGLFWSRGSSLSGGPCPLPAGDYSSQHLAREGGGVYLDAQPFYMCNGYVGYSGIQGPVITNETRGASNTVNSNSRTTDAKYFRRVAGAMRGWSGGTFHFDDGIHTQFLTPGTPQDQCRLGFLEGIR